MKRALVFLVWVSCVAAVSGQTEGGGVDRDKLKEVSERALAAFGKDDLAGARKGFQEMLDLDPGNATALVNLGLVEQRAGRAEKALEWLERAVQVDPKASPAWGALGMLRQARREWDEALADLSKAIAIEPNNAGYRNLRAALLAEMGWSDGAVSELLKAVEIQPNYAQAHFNLALLYLERDPPAVELARRHYFRALELGEKPDAGLEKRIERP